MQQFPECGWFTSSYTGPNGGDCVEINQQLRDVVGIRDSKDRRGPQLVIDRAIFRAFLDSVTL